MTDINLRNVELTSVNKVLEKALSKVGEWQHGYDAFDSGTYNSRRTIGSLVREAVYRSGLPSYSEEKRLVNACIFALCRRLELSGDGGKASGLGFREYCATLLSRWNAEDGRVKEDVVHTLRAFDKLPW